jgi:hypothetical protein
MGEWSNKERKQKVPGIQRKWKYNLPDFVRQNKDC